MQGAYSREDRGAQFCVPFEAGRVMDVADKAPALFTWQNVGESLTRYYH